MVEQAAMQQIPFLFIAIKLFKSKRKIPVHKFTVVVAWKAFFLNQPSAVHSSKGARVRRRGGGGGFGVGFRNPKNANKTKIFKSKMQKDRRQFAR